MTRAGILVMGVVVAGLAATAPAFAADPAAAEAGTPAAPLNAAPAHEGEWLKSPESAPDAGRFGNRPADDAYGAFQRGLYLTALNLALPRAEDGDGSAQMLVAEIYARGLGTARNVAEATRWYMAAAGQGIAEAQLQAALILLGDKPLDRSNPNRDEALTMLRAAADQDNAFAAFNLAQIVMADRPGEGGAEEAAPLFQKAARLGVADADYALAKFYESGVGGLGLSSEKALEHLSRAARAGIDTAQLDLATSYADGLLTGRDYPKAFQWMHRCATGAGNKPDAGGVAAGNPVCMTRLAKLYRSGLGIEGDPIEAAAWYIRAKRAGITDAELDVFMDGLADDERADALTRANKVP